MPAKTAKAKMNFESQMDALEAVTAALEQGGMPLEESISLYKQGVELAKRLEAMLADGERRVTQLIESGAEIPFDDGVGER